MSVVGVGRLIPTQHDHTTTTQPEASSRQPRAKNAIHVRQQCRPSILEMIQGGAAEPSERRERGQAHPPFARRRVCVGIVGPPPPNDAEGLVALWIPACCAWCCACLFISRGEGSALAYLHIIHHTTPQYRGIDRLSKLLAAVCCFQPTAVVALLGWIVVIACGPHHTILLQQPIPPSCWLTD